jgi:hypothetical protein
VPAIDGIRGWERRTWGERAASITRVMNASIDCSCAERPDDLLVLSNNFGACGLHYLLDQPKRPGAMHELLARPAGGGRAMSTSINWAAIAMREVWTACSNVERGAIVTPRDPAQPRAYLKSDWQK